MEITINVRRVLRLSLIGFITVFMVGLTTACGAGFANNRSKSTYEVDDGVTPVKRVTVSHEGSANGASVGLPLLGGISGVGGYGAAGYGAPIVGGGNLCMVHPDYCGTIVTVSSPVVAQPGYAPQGTNPDLENRVTHLEKKSEVNRQILIRDNQNRKIILGTLDSALMLNPQSCTYITAKPETLTIEGHPELTKTVRAQVLTKCSDILGAQKGNQ